MSLENQTYLASRKDNGDGKEINCIIGLSNNTHSIETHLDALKAGGWVIIPKLKFERLVELHNEGKEWFWDSRNIPYAIEAERDNAEATYTSE